MLARAYTGGHAHATKCGAVGRVWTGGDINRGQMLPRVVKKASERARAGIKQLKILERLLLSTKRVSHARNKVPLSHSRAPFRPQNILKAL